MLSQLKCPLCDSGMNIGNHPANYPVTKFLVYIRCKKCNFEKISYCKEEDITNTMYKLAFEIRQARNTISFS